MFELTLSRRQVSKLSASSLMALFENANYDFIKWRWHAIAFSALIIIAGLAYGVAKGMPLGIDFSGGTIVVVKFEQPVSDDQVRAGARRRFPASKVDPALRRCRRAIRMLIRLPAAPPRRGQRARARARARSSTR